MAEPRTPTAVSGTPCTMTIQESSLLQLQALVTALISSSLELAPHHAKPEQVPYVVMQAMKIPYFRQVSPCMSANRPISP